MAAETKRRPWDQQDGESAKAFAAFRAYRDLGDERTQLKAFRAYSGNQSVTSQPGYFRQWSASNDWPARVEAWDSEQERIADAEAERNRARGRRIASNAIKSLLDGLISMASDEQNSVRDRVAATRLALEVTGVLTEAKGTGRLENLKQNQTDTEPELVRLWLPDNGTTACLPITT